MLNLYISHAPQDSERLATLLEWLRPLEERYFLRIWFNQAPRRVQDLPLPWNLLLFWYSPPRPPAPFQPDPPLALYEGHIYLFLTSHHSLTMPHIDQVEIPIAASRYAEHGSAYVRIFPVLLAPSLWKTYSRLAHFAPLGPKKTLQEITPHEEGYREVVNQLQPIIETLRRNWMEKYQRDGLPIDEFNRPAPQLLAGPPGIAPLPGWMGWVMLALLLYSIMNWYARGCSPKIYHGEYKPLLPIEERPEEYPRDQRIQPPAPVVLPSDPDSLPAGIEPDN